MMPASVALRRTYERRFDDGLPLITDLLITDYFPSEPRIRIRK
jgi:hypothetical protein